MIKITERGLDEVRAYLKTVPYGCVKTALLALKDYFLDENSWHGLRHYEPYKTVSRKKAYGRTFQSDKQRKWFWANGGPDMIGNHRTGESANAWNFKTTNSGYGVTLYNDSEGAKWIWSDRQAAQPRLVGHRTARAKIASNMAGAIRHARSEVGKWLRSK